MSREPFEAMPDVMDAKQLAEALQISKAGAYNLLSSPGFPTLRIGGREYSARDCAPQPLKLSIHSGGIEHPCRCR